MTPSRDRRSSTKTSSRLALAAALLCGCAAAPIPGGEEERADDLVGVADLALIERTFGLERDVKVDGVFTRDPARGRCLAAYPGAQLRRYKTGAAFFSPHRADDPERGHDRPVQCVDLDEPGMALDGVALDAVFRFDLGRPLGFDAAPGGEIYVGFERGALHVLTTDSARGPSADEVAAQRGTRGASVVGSPLFVDGYLADVTRRGLRFHGRDASTAEDALVISGSLAAFAYAAGYARTGSAFSFARDPLGSLRDVPRDRALVDEHRTASSFRQALYLPIATLIETVDVVPTGTRRTLRLGGPSNPGDPLVESHVVCHEEIIDDGDGPAARPFACTGL
jgi:hypothetical protein